MILLNTSPVPPLTMGPVQVGIGEGSLAVGQRVRKDERGDVRASLSLWILYCRVAISTHDTTQHNTTQQTT